MAVYLNPLRNPSSLILIGSALGASTPTPPPDGALMAPLWITSANQKQSLQLQPPQAVGIVAATGSQGVIALNSSKTFQSFDGVGGALTEASAGLLKGLSSGKRSAALNQLFNTNPKVGLGLTQLRVPVEPTDFSMDVNTTYIANEGGPFSLAIDESNILPILKQILAINPNIRIISAPWTSPPWMKNSGSTCGGNVTRSHYDDFASYLVSFVQAYAAQGVKIAAITPGNEPLVNSGEYPSTGWDGESEGSFIANHLAPAFANATLGTQIWGYDHNYDNLTFPAQVLSAAPSVQDIAFHCYAGDPSAMKDFSKDHPGINLHLTECSGGTWAQGSFTGVGYSLLGALANGASSALLWNLVLDNSGGPTFSGGTTSRGVLTVSGGNFQATEQHAALGHVSKFVQPGAQRIDLDLSNQADSITATALKNPDNTIAVLALNEHSASVAVTVQNNGINYAFELPGQSIATLGLGINSALISAAVGHASTRQAWLGAAVALATAAWLA